MIRTLQQLVVLASLCWLRPVAAGDSISSSGSLFPSLSSLANFPGAFSKDFVQDALDKEIRRTIIEWSAESNRTRAAALASGITAADEPEDPVFQRTSTTRSLRSLASDDDWDTVNEILGSFTVNIPAFDASIDAAGITLQLSFNGTCSQASVEDILLDWDKSNTDDGEVTLAYKLQVLGAKLKCFINIDWNTGVLDVSDNIKMKLILNDNNFGLAVNLIGSPPTNSTFLGCKVQVNIGDIATSGGFSSDIINDLDYLIVDLVRNEAGLISGQACGLLTAAGATVNELLATVLGLLEPFLALAEDVDPLFLENNLDPSLPPLVNFQDTEGVGNIVNVLVTNLGGVITADTINGLITGVLGLDEDGTFTLQLAEPPVFDELEQRYLQANTTGGGIADVLGACLGQSLGGLLGRRRLIGYAIDDHLGLHSPLELEEDDRRLQEIGFRENLTLESLGLNVSNILGPIGLTPLSISITGLNNFTDGAPLAIIGEHTFLTELALDQIYVEADLALDVDINGVPVQEIITIGAEITGIYLNTSYLVGLDEEEVNSWTIGTLLNISNILDCVQSVLVTAGVSQLEVTVAFIGTPAVSGIISDGVNDLVSDLLEGVVCAYQDLITGAIPGFFQNNVTAIVNEFIDCFLASNNATCPESDLAGLLPPTPAPGDVEFDFRSIRPSVRQDSGFVPGFLDFRDLLLPPEQAKALGGSGIQPYGDLMSTVYSGLMGMLTGYDNATGLLGINAQLPVDPLALIPGDLFSFPISLSDLPFVGSLADNATIGASNIRVQNLNTIVNPLSVLEPTRSAHVLSNMLNMGPVPGRPVGANMTMFVAVDGEGSPLALSNELDAATSVNEMDVLADLLVMISTLDFLQFPLSDVDKISCWLALVQEPNHMVEGEMMENSIEVTKMMLHLMEMSVGFECLNCTSTLLPGAIQILEDVGAMAVLGERLGPLIEEILTSDMIPPMLTDLIGLGVEAGRKCPHSPHYNTTSNATVAFELEIPMLSSKSIDTLVYTGILGAEVFAVVLSEAVLANDVPPSDPLSGQKSLDTTSDENLLDWYRLNETFIPFLGDGLDLVRNFLGGENGTVGANSLFGESLNLSLGISFELEGYMISVDEVQVTGLNSFKRMDVLEPVGPQTLKNTIEMENLTVALDFSLDAINTTEPAQSYRVSFDVNDVNATIYLFAAIDMDKVEALEIGQLLFISNLLPCMLSTARDVSLPAMYVSIGNISEPVVEGLMPDTSEAAEASLEGIFNNYSSVIVEATNGIFDSTLRVVLNEALASFIQNTSGCLTSSELYDSEATDLIDFRDLLLPPEAAEALGGSGMQPYGDIVSMAYSLVLDLLVSSGDGELLGLNSFIDSFTEGQSGEPGMILLEGELLGLAIELTEWIKQRIELAIFDARVRNLNTLVSPIAVAYPTRDPFVVENMVNFGPIEGKPLSATLGTLLALEGDLQGLDMYNMFDLGASLSEIDLVAAVSLQILEERLFRFPLRDILEVPCWLSLLQSPNATAFEAGASGFKIESFLSKLASLSVGVDCLNCTSRVLADVIELVDDAGASETFGNRLGFLLEDIATSDSVASLLGGFIELGDDAARSCPHHPLFIANYTELSNETSTSSGLSLPLLSSMSVDTILFAGVVFAEVAVVVGADSHLQNPGQPTEPLSHQNSLDIPEDANLIDWGDLDDVGIPFLSEIFNLVRSLVGVTVNEDGTTSSGINGLISGLLDETGTFELPLNGLTFDISGIRILINSVRASGLDKFTEFDILNPVAPQTLQNNLSLERMTVELDVGVDIIETDEPANNLTVKFELENINASVPIFAAVDEDLLGALKLGSLLHLNNILPCLLSATYGFQFEQFVVTVGNISEPVFGGFFPDTNEAVANSTAAIFDVYHDMIRDSIPLVFQDTVRVAINSFLTGFEDSDCKDYSTNTTDSFIDFRKMFQPSNSTLYSPYGDIIPILKGLLEAQLFENNPETQMPKINDMVIAPFTEDQSGVKGRLLLPGKIFGFDTAALADVGLEKLGVDIYDALADNLDTVGQPLYVLEPNQTRGDLIDNGATFGTQFRPLRFSIKFTLSIEGSFVSTHDVMEVFGDIRSAPIFSVLLARIGAQEFLELPLEYTSNVDCWLGLLAAPALRELEAGNLAVNPVLLMEYLSIAFQNMQIGASCYNCTTRGLDAVADLLEIVETTEVKNVMGNRNVDLLLNLIRSDFVQVWLLRIFQDSIRKCPHSENSPLVPLVVPNTGFPQLSAYDMETGVFTVTVIIQLGLVILAETIAGLEGVEPILSDPVPDIPPGTRLVDFTALDTFPNGRLALSVIGGLNDLLGQRSVDPDTGEVTVEINGILNQIESVLGLGIIDVGDLSVTEFTLNEELDVGIGNLNVKFMGVTISGLNTFTQFSVANITGPTTMRHDLGWERLQLEIQLEVDLSGDPTFLRSLQEATTQDTSDGKFQFALTIELADILAVAETFVALDYELLKYVELGSFLRFANILPCLQATILHLEFTELALQIGRVTKMQVSGWQSEDTATAAENLEETLLEKYGETIASMAPTVFSVLFRPLLNTVVTDYLRNSDVKCDEFPFDPSTEGFVDFRDLLLPPTKALELGGTGKEQYGDIIHTIYGFTGAAISFAIGPAIENLNFPGSLFDYGIRFDVREFRSVLVLKVSDLSFENFKFKASPTPFLIPQQDEPFRLNNDLQFGDTSPILVKFRVYFAFKGLGDELSEADIANDFEVSMDIDTLAVLLNVLAKVGEEDFVRFPLRNMLNLNCWLATIPPPDLDEMGRKLADQESNLIAEYLNISLAQLNMGIECFNCTSPGLEEWHTMLQEPGSAEELTRVLNVMFSELVERFGGDFLQDQIDSLLVQAPRHCEHTDNYDPNAPPYQFSVSPAAPEETLTYLTYLAAIAIPLVLAVIIIIGVRLIVHRRHRKWLRGLPSERVFLIQQKQEKEEHMESELNELTRSMYESEEIPCLARYIVPIIVVVNIGFFLSGHLSLGGRAQVDFYILGEFFRVESFYSFSIAQSTLDMWHAGGEELAALILLFSGIWPYTKQLITLALWFLPPSVVSISRRGQFLLWLDILAKWSMIDIFVLLITVAGFRVGGTSPDFPFLPANMWSIQLVVVPMWGLYANMLAQIMSQISSHFIVMYHRRILRNGKKKYMERHHPQQAAAAAEKSGGMTVEHQEDSTELLSHVPSEEEKKDALCKYAFTRPHKLESAKLVPRNVMNGLLPIFCALLAVLLVFCCIWPSLILEGYGVVGIFIEVGFKFAQDAVREESIFSKTKILIDQAKYLDELKHYIGNGFLAFLMITTLLVVPILTLISLMYLWLVPQTRKRKERMAVVLEILQAWQYVEVYILGIIIESWQLGHISKLFLNRYCESINPVLELIAGYGVIDPRDAQCFELAAEIGWGAYALIPFVIGLALVGTYVIKAYIQALREQSELEYAISEDEKLRAFDRTTWDNRETALENIQNPPVLFTDTFRWTLRKDPSATNNNLGPMVGVDGAPKALDGAPTYVVDTDSSEGDQSSRNGDQSSTPTPDHATLDNKSLSDEFDI